MQKLNLVETKKYLYPIIIGFGIIAVMSLIMMWEGRLTVCACGYIKFWYGQVISSENSQHLFDWYSFTHFLHGLIFYGLLWLVDRKKKLSVTTKLLIAIGGAAAWEILENSSFVINRYRSETVSLDYYGDSIVNSIGDVFSMALGFFFALKSKWWVSLIILIVIEIALAYTIRDNLTINIIMLIHPVEALKMWQQGL